MISNKTFASAKEKARSGGESERAFIFGTYRRTVALQDGGDDMLIDYHGASSQSNRALKGWSGMSGRTIRGRQVATELKLNHSWSIKRYTGLIALPSLAPSSVDL